MEKTCINDEDFIFYFSDKKKQILFEFWFIITIFLFTIIFLALLALDIFQIKLTIRNLFVSGLSGMLGGIIFVAKWFYRVTARGKNNQYCEYWEPHKIYWRILTPIVSSCVALTIYALATRDVLPIKSLNNNSGYVAFGFSFLVGYFSDMFLSMLVDFVSTICNTNKKTSTSTVTNQKLEEK